MPTEVSAHAALVWFSVGFCTGVGWALGTALISAIAAKF